MAPRGLQKRTSASNITLQIVIRVNMFAFMLSSTCTDTNRLSSLCKNTVKTDAHRTQNSVHPMANDNNNNNNNNNKQNTKTSSTRLHMKRRIQKAAPNRPCTSPQNGMRTPFAIKAYGDTGAGSDQICCWCGLGAPLTVSLCTWSAGARGLNSCSRPQANRSGRAFQE